MARLCTRKAEILLIVEEIMFEIVFMMALMLRRRANSRLYRHGNGTRTIRYKMADNIPKQVENLHDLVEISDVDCFENLRMNRFAFTRLCYLLSNFGGLIDGRYVLVPEQVALFLSVLLHHTKMRVVKFRFKRSLQTLNHHFHRVLGAVLKLQNVLLATPTAVDDGCTDTRCRPFKGCLGALDGTYIDVTVPEEDKPWYRTRKETISDTCWRHVTEICDLCICYLVSKALPLMPGSCGMLCTSSSILFYFLQTLYIRTKPEKSSTLSIPCKLKRWKCVRTMSG